MKIAFSGDETSYSLHPENHNFERFCLRLFTTFASQIVASNCVVFALFLRFQRTQERPNRSKTREDIKLLLNLANLHSFSPRSHRTLSRRLLRNCVLFPSLLRFLRTKNRSKRSSIREDMQNSY